MASQFHNRLIGTVILVSIGVIFLPDLLTGKHHKPQVPVDSMPLNPQEVAAKSPVSAAPATNGVSGANTATAQGTQVAQAGTQVSGSGASGVIVAGNSATTQPATTQPATPTAAAQAPAALQQGSGQWTTEEVATPVTVKTPAHVNSAAALAAATGAAAVANKVHQPKPQPVKPSVPVEKPATVRAYDSAAAVVANSAGTTGTMTTASSQNAAAQTAAQPRKATRVQSGQIRSFADVIADDHGGTAAAKTAAPAAQAKPSAQQTAPAPTAAAKPAAPVAKPTTPAPAAAPATSGGAAWVIQAGVFSNADNAKSLVAKLRAGGMPASLVPIHGGLYRVTVGPDVSRSNMESMVPRVSSIAGTSAKLLSYATHQ